MVARTVARAYLFDLDGTLLDSVELILSSFRHTYRAHFATDLDDQVWRDWIGTPLRTILAAHARSDEELESLISTYIEHNLAHHHDHARGFPHATEVVRELARRGAPVAIVTSKMRAGTEMGLELLELGDAFGAVITADDVSRGKPDPEPVFLALEQLGVPRSEAAEVVFIGDSPHDIHAGRAAGVRTAAAPWGPYDDEALRASGPDLWLRDLRHVLEL